MSNRERTNNCGEVGADMPRSPDPGPVESMAQFDSLPMAMRELLASAPFNYNTGNVITALSRFSIDEALAKAAQSIKDQTRQEARNAYGPDHPQAKES